MDKFFNGIVNIGRGTQLSIPCTILPGYFLNSVARATIFKYNNSVFGPEGSGNNSAEIFPLHIAIFFWFKFRVTEPEINIIPEIPAVHAAIYQSAAPRE
jgi:hypothetical protein